MRPDAAALDAAELQRPGDLQVLDVARVDLVEGGETMGTVIFTNGEPVSLLLVGVQEALTCGFWTLGDDGRFGFYSWSGVLSKRGCREY